MFKPLIAIYYPLLSGLGGLLASQTLKLLLILIQEKRIDWEKVFSAGGMPSSHSAMVCGLTTALGMKYGWESVPFAIGVIFSLVVIYDAAGVRQAVGHQATILNRLRERVNQQPIEKGERLQEVMGHTPIEILAGIIVGVGVALLLHI